MYRIFTNSFCLFQIILISYFNRVTSRFEIFKSDYIARSEQEIFQPYPIHNGFLASIMAAYESCQESARLGLLSTHPDQYKKTSELLETHGYPYETHNVTTEDGYILTVYRIIGSPNLSPDRWANKRKYPVYLAHGTIMASDGWNFQSKNKSLPFKLADAGFDVWLANARGTTYSMGHNEYNPEEDLQFWDFSFPELGMYDVPAVTNKILLESGAPKILYIGHSQGTLQLFIALSAIPEINEMVKAAFMLAPAAHAGHTNHPARHVVPLLSSYTALQILNPILQGRVGLPHITFGRFNISIGDFCLPTAIQCTLCAAVIYGTNGFNTVQTNTADISNIVAKTGNTVSAKIISHILQKMAAGKFGQYDYGYDINMEKYGSPHPPEYKLGNIQTPMYFYYGESDRIITPKDVEFTASLLAPGVLKELHKVEDELWNHNDFVYAKDADKLVYNRIVDEMERLSPI